MILNPTILNTILVIVGLILGLLTLVNTIALVIGVSAISLLLVRMSGQFATFADVRQSLAELTKVIEQQTRLLEYIGKKFG